jgi:GABA(A) receptor-associated protein
MGFREQHPFEVRAAESIRIRDKFPGRVPVIVERGLRSKTVPTIDKHKFLVPGDLTLGQFTYVIRTRIHLSPESALFLFVNNSLPTTGSLMKELFWSQKDADGFLYVQYCGENTFGLTK